MEVSARERKMAEKMRKMKARMKAAGLSVSESESWQEEEEKADSAPLQPLSQAAEENTEVAVAPLNEQIASALEVAARKIFFKYSNPAIPITSSLASPTPPLPHGLRLEVKAQNNAPRTFICRVMSALHGRLQKPMQQHI